MYTIIHQKGDEGLGDFIRGSLYLYDLSIKRHWNFYINMSDYPYLEKCFDLISYIQPIDNFKTIYIRSNGKNCLISDLYQQIDTNILDLVNETKTLLIWNNCIDINIDLDDQTIHQFFDKILKPNTTIIDRMNSIYSNLHLQSNHYISVHVRCGDYNMELELKGRTARRDRRVNLNQININQYHDLIMNIIKDDTSPILIHSDSSRFKSLIQNISNRYINLNLKIEHVGQKIGENNEDSYMDTITEFYIMSNAKYIIMINSYSGFSHMASLVYGKPVYVNFNYNMFNHLNRSKIIYI